MHVALDSEAKKLETWGAELAWQIRRFWCLGRPDLVLMGVLLPGIDGLKATQIIKGDPALKEIPVVALTSYAMQGDEEKAVKAVVHRLHNQTF